MPESHPWQVTPETDGWSAFLEGTADRSPLAFLELALEWAGDRPDQSRLAVDLGCGGGAETLELLRRGWRVFATDSSPSSERLIRERISPELEDRLTIEIGRFEEVELPDAELVFAQMSLPFAGSNLDQATSNAIGAVRRGGVFAGHFFGKNDDWIDGVNVAAVDRTWIDDRFDGWGELSVDEADAVGPYGLESGVKHWHYYFVLGRR